jgi:ribosomal protein S18 acetylase RimI-like enzyme
MVIRNAVYVDCNGLSALSIYVWINTYAKEGIDDKVSKYVLSEFAPEKYKEIINSPNKKILLAKVENFLIGLVVIDLDAKYQSLDDYGYEICTLYVHPKFQKKGVGKKLLNAIKDKYGKYCWLTAWIHNELALGFYQAIGFKIIGKAEFQLIDEVYENHVLSNR